MTFDEYITDRIARDPAFREAWEESRPLHEFRKAVIGARLAAGLSQSQLAKRMGTSQAAVARLESGEHLPSVGTMQRLAIALGLEFTIGPQSPLIVRAHEAA